jgi:hypothetical protein
MKLELSEDQALVLFEWLSRLDEQDALPCEDESEEVVLWALHGQLEKLLAAQFDPGYRELIAKARERVKTSQEAG